jgi:hypothetical protein
VELSSIMSVAVSGTSEFANNVFGNGSFARKVVFPVYYVKVRHTLYWLYQPGFKVQRDDMSIKHHSCVYSKLYYV